MAKQPRQASKSGTATSGQPASPRTLQQLTQTFAGPLPPPSLLQQYDAIIPHAAERILAMAEAEAEHRQALEHQANTANVAAQQQQLALASAQTKGVYRSDLIGQTLGFLVSCISLGGCIYLAIHNQPWVAGLLAGLPLAAVIRALRDRASRAEPPSES